MQRNLNLNRMFYPSRNACRMFYSSRNACSSPWPWKAYAENQTWYYAMTAKRETIGSGCSRWKRLVSVGFFVIFSLFPCMLTWFTGSVLPCRVQILHRGRRAPVCSFRCSNVVRCVGYWWWWRAFIRYIHLMIYCRQENNKCWFILQEENDYSRRAQSESSTDTCKSIGCSRGSN